MIAIGGWEKFRGGSRVEFLCGGRALQRFRVWRDALSAMQKHLSVPPIEMAAAIERMQDEPSRCSGRVRGFQEKLAVHEAQALLARGDGWPDRRSDRGLGRAGPEGDRHRLPTHRGEPDAVVALFTAATPAKSWSRAAPARRSMRARC